MTADRYSRRRYLVGAASALATSAAGCLAPVGGRSTGASTEGARATGGTATGSDESVYTRVYRDAIDAVALLRTYGGADQGQGTGFAYADPNHVLTNHHVVAGASSLELRFSRGEWRTGEVIGGDVYSDLAVVRVDDPPDYATPLTLVDEPPVIGQEVVTIGSPFGLEKSLSAGVVSGVHRTIPARGGFTIPDAVQTDAAVNPGNSGGPLMTLDGRVVGVIRSGGGENIGFAVSAALVERVAPALIESGAYRHSYMGVRLVDVTPTVAEANDLGEPRGVLVADVLSGGPADGVLRGSDGQRVVNGVPVPTGGDVIVALEGDAVAATGDLARHLALETRPGETIPVAVVRDGERETVDLTLGARPEPSGLG